MFTYAAA